MPIDDGAVGRDGVVVVRVDSDLTADRYGNAGLAALATPALVGLFEQAAMRALEGLLAEGEGSVGSLMEIEHARPEAAAREVRPR